MGNNQSKSGNKSGGQPTQEGDQQAQSKMQDAAQTLEDLADEMQQMQNEMEELQDLEEMMEEINQCKGQCQGQARKNQNPKWNDWAKGKGRGGGKRAKSEDDETGSYRSRVKGKIQRGETVVTGSADGKNLPGRSLSEARELVKSSISKESDPLENQKLPRTQREHVKQYFERLRTGR